MFQRVSEKYEDLLFRFICECELDPPQNPALLAAVEILELLSLLQLYLNRWTPGVAESPLVSVFVGKFLELWECNLQDSAIEQYLFYVLLSTVLLLPVLLLVCIKTGNGLCRTLVMFYMAASPLLYNKLLYTWFYSDGSVPCLAWRVVCFPGLLFILVISLATKRKHRRVSELVCQVLITITPQHSLVFLGVLTVANWVGYWGERTRPCAGFRIVAGPVCFVYCVVASRLPPETTEDVLFLFYLGVCMMLAVLNSLAEISATNCRMFATSNTEELLVHLSTTLLEHSCRCVSPSCLCLEASPPFTADSTEPLQSLILSVSTSQKEDSLQHSLQFEDAYDFALYCIARVDYSTRGLLGLYMVRPKGIVERYRRHRIVNKYRASMEVNIKTKNLVSPIEIEKSFQNYEGFRKTMGGAVLVLKEFYEGLELQSSFDQNRFEKVAETLQTVEISFEALREHELTLHTIKFSHMIFQELILNARTKGQRQGEVSVDPFVIVASNRFLRCNESFERLMGAPKEYFLDNEIDSYLPRPFQLHHKEWTEKYIRESNTSYLDRESPKYMICHSGSCRRINLSVKILPRFDNGIETICFFKGKKRDSSCFVMVDKKDDCLVALSQEFMRLLGIRVLSRVELERSLHRLHASEVVPFVFDESQRISVNIDALTGIRDRDNNFKPMEMLKFAATKTMVSSNFTTDKCEISVMATFLDHIKVVEVKNFADRRTDVLRSENSEEELRMPKETNAVHPELPPSKLRTPFEMFGLVVLFTILFRVFYLEQLGQPRALSVFYTSYETVLDGSILLLERANNISVLRLSNTTELQSDTVVEGEDRQEFRRVLDILLAVQGRGDGWVASQDQQRVFEHVRHKLRQGTGAALGEAMGDWIRFGSMGVVVVVAIVVYVSLTYSVLRTQKNVSLVFEAFMLLDEKEISRILVKIKGLLEYFSQYSAQVQQLGIEDTEIDLVEEKLPAPETKVKRTSLTEQTKSIATMLELIARETKQPLSFLGVAEPPPAAEEKEIKFSRRRLVSYTLVLSVGVTLFLVFHIVWAYYLGAFIFELNSALSYHSSKLKLTASVKLTVASAVTDQSFPEDPLAILNEIQSKSEALSAEFRGFVQRATQMERGDFCEEGWQRMERYPNSTRELCRAWKPGTLDSGELATITYIFEQLRLLLKANSSTPTSPRTSPPTSPRTSPSLLLRTILQTISFLQAVQPSLAGLFTSALQEVSSHRNIQQTMFQILAVSACLIMLLLIHNINRKVVQNEKRTVTLLRTIERGMFESNKRLYDKFKQYLPE